VSITQILYIDARLTEIFSVVSDDLYAASRTFHYMFECTNILIDNLHFGVALATEVLSHGFSRHLFKISLKMLSGIGDFNLFGKSITSGIPSR